MPAIGDVLGEKFRVLALLGEGAMGAVYRAENIVTGKHFAIKVMHPHVAQRADAASRLLREARTASQLSHPNVVDVYDIVVTGTTLLLVMELLEGETLRAYLIRNPYPKISEFIALLLPALDGVAAAHEQGVIHRDLKPENIFLARRRAGRGVVPKVVDFGIAKVAADRGMTLTETGTTIGTPLYMSLEQLRGDRNIDGRADVYAFGAMLYEAVCGRPPYRADNLAELAIKIATTDPPPAKSIRVDLPTPLARLIDKSLARDRDQRVSDIRTLQEALESFARDDGFQQQMTNPNAEVPRLAGALLERDAAEPAKPAPASSDPSAAAEVRSAGRVNAPDTLAARELAGGRRTRHRTSMWGAAIALAAIGGVVGYIRTRETHESNRDHVLAPSTASASPAKSPPDKPASLGGAPATSARRDDVETVTPDPSVAAPKPVTRTPVPSAAPKPAAAAAGSVARGGGPADAVQKPHSPLAEPPVSATAAAPGAQQPNPTPAKQNAGLAPPRSGAIATPQRLPAFPGSTQPPAPASKPGSAAGTPTRASSSPAQRPSIPSAAPPSSQPVPRRPTKKTAAEELAF